MIPCLLLRGLGLVKTVNFQDPTYIGDPINAVKIFNDLKADELIFLDILATPENKSPPFELIQKIGDECAMPFSVGGGINTIEDVTRILRAGAEKVCINSAAVEKPSFVTEVAERFGSQSVVVSIDYKKKLFGNYTVFVNCGSQSTGWHPVDWAKEVQNRGAGEILLNSIDRDGTMQSYDLDIMKEVSQAVEIPVIACGGAGSIMHFKEAVDSGASAVAAGSMFVYHGRRNGILINFPSQEDLAPLFISQYD